MFGASGTLTAETVLAGVAGGVAVRPLGDQSSFGDASAAGAACGLGGARVGVNGLANVGCSLEYCTVRMSLGGSSRGEVELVANCGT